MIGRAISHYRVLSALGSGGMGVVYLAEDERLGRHVALKFLPPDSARNRQALDRFRVEARAASSLSHPGICAIYDIGEDEGTPFIVMEALRGETLRDRINKGPVKVADLLEIGIQLADALEAAHSQGIIHRDIKPSNIFIGEKNRAKILDFGLAKLSSGAAWADGGTDDASSQQTVVKQITIPGSALGTVSYMSPEQARGEDVDTRTDLFSLGAVLYEMATGNQAFGGSTPAVVFDQILNHTPPVLANLNPLVPPRLEAIINTLLEKDRDLRYQHASDLQAELKRLRRDLDSGTMMSISASRTSVSTPAAPGSDPRVSTQTPPPQPQPVPWWRYGVLAIAVLIVGAVAFTIWSGPPAGTPPASVDRTVTTTPPAAAPATAVAPAPAQPESAPAVAPAPVTTPQARTSAPSPVPTPPAPRSTPTTPPPDSRGAGAPARAAAPASPVQKDSVPTPPTQTAQVPPPTPTSIPAPTPVAPAPVTPAPAAAADAPPAAPVAPPPPSPPAPARAAETAPAPPAPRANASDAPAAVVESDDAAIRRVIATYKTAIETKNVSLFRSVRPGLSAAEENRLRESFRQIDSQQVAIAIDEIRVDGRTATARISRQDVFTSAGRRQTQSIRQTLRFEKTATGWIIASIGG